MGCTATTGRAWLDAGSTVICIQIRRWLITAILVKFSCICIPKTLSSICNYAHRLSSGHIAKHGHMLGQFEGVQITSNITFYTSGQQGRNISDLETPEKQMSQDSSIFKPLIAHLETIIRTLVIMSWNLKPYCKIFLHTAYAAVTKVCGFMLVRPYKYSTMFLDKSNQILKNTRR